MLRVTKLDTSLLAMALVLCPTVAFLAILRPLLLLILCGIVVTFVIMTQPIGRLLVVIIGGLVAFQSTSGASAEKLAYLAALVVCTAVGIWRLPTILADPRFLRVFGGALRASAVLVTYLLATLALAVRNGTSTTSWIRDVTTYLLLAVAPVIALDAGSAISVRWAVRLLTMGSALGAAAFSASWLQRRGVAVGGIGHFMLASFALGIVGFCYGLTRALTPGTRRPWWVFYTVLLFLLPLITGTRTTLVLLTALVGVLGTRSKSRANPFKVGALVFGAGALAFALLPFLTRRLINDPAFLQKRYSDAISFLTNGGSKDQSYLERALAYSYAHSAFKAHPLFGVGLGHLYPAVEPFAPPTLTLDTPILVFSKFGFAGCLVLAYFFWAILRGLHTHRQFVGWSAESTTLRAAVVVWIFMTPFGVILEDKGFALSVILLLALFAATLRASGSRELRDFVAGETLVADNEAVGRRHSGQRKASGIITADSSLSTARSGTR